MCGIAGIILCNSGESDPGTLRRAVHRMNRAQRQRGPDGEGAWSDGRVGLGCVRLAITGDDERGLQPLEDRWGGRLVFNGEVYGHEGVLRSLGEPVPPGASDGVALAAVLARRGPDGLPGVRGMFAAAQYDAARGTLLLVRDAFGKKPLYYRRTRKGWVFASTVAALRAVSGPMRLRPEAVAEYLVYRSVGGHHSAFEGVEQVPPGSWMELGVDGRLRRGRWWAPPDLGDSNATASAVRDAVDAAVAARDWSGGEVGVFLSGGLDSSIVAASLCRQRPDRAVRFLSVGYDVPGWEDERTQARTLAASLGPPHEEVILTAAEVPQLLKDVALGTEDPIQDPVLLPTLRLARAAARFTKVVLTGDGSDEVWGGYARFDDVPESLHDYLPRTAIFRPEELGLPGPPVSYLDGLTVPPEELPPLDRVLRLEVSNRLRNYHLARIDKLTMAAGLEARCPFLDIEAAALALRIAAVRKRPEGRPKGLLADAFADSLPGWLLRRRKQPFSVPIGAWLSGPLRGFARETLLARGAFVRGFIDPLPVLDRLDSADDVACAARIWSLLQLEVWYGAVRPWAERRWSESESSLSAACGQ